MFTRYRCLPLLFLLLFGCVPNELVLGEEPEERTLYIPDPLNPSQPLYLYILPGTGQTGGSGLIITPPLRRPEDQSGPETDVNSVVPGDLEVVAYVYPEDEDFKISDEEELALLPFEEPIPVDEPPLPPITMDNFRSAVLAFLGDRGRAMLHVVDNWVEAGTDRLVIELGELVDNVSFREIDNGAFNIHIDTFLGPNPREMHRVVSDFIRLFFKKGSLFETPVGSLTNQFNKALVDLGILTDPKGDLESDSLIEEFSAGRLADIQQVAELTAFVTKTSFQVLALTSTGGIGVGVNLAFTVEELKDPDWTTAMDIIPFLKLPANGVLTLVKGNRTFCQFSADQVKLLRSLVDNKNLSLVGKIQTFRRAATVSIDTLDVVTSAMFCFPEGTLVKAENGYVAIEDLKAGDRVWAYAEGTGIADLQPIEHVWSKNAPEIVTLDLSNGLKRIELTTTPSHPFFVRYSHNSYGWVEAKDLEPGSILVSHAGKATTLLGKFLARQETPVYSIGVANYHTYFVSTLDILCHNSKCRGSKILEEFGGIGNFLKVATDQLTDAEAVQLYRMWLKRGVRNGIPTPAKYLKSRTRKLVADAHEWVPVGSMTEIANKCETKKALQESFDLVNGVRSNTKSILFDKKALEALRGEVDNFDEVIDSAKKFGHSASGGSTKVFSSVFHKKLIQFADKHTGSNGLNVHAWYSELRSDLLPKFFNDTVRINGKTKLQEIADEIKDSANLVLQSQGKPLID